MTSKKAPTQNGINLKRHTAEERFALLYREIRSRICLVVYRPGSRLSENELAKEFGVSRTPICRVLARLEAEGLVESSQGSATSVTAIDLSSLEDKFELRARLIGVAADLGFRKTSARDIREMQTICRQIKRLRAAPTASQFAEVNLRFHNIFLSLVRNVALREIMELLYVQTNRIWMNELPFINWSEEISLSEKQIGMMITAMEENDSEVIGSVERHIIKSSFDRVKKYKRIEA